MTVKMPLPEQSEIASLCRRHHIRRLSIFGSALRDDFSLESDIDILVEFRDGKKPGFFRLVEIQEEFSELFGRKVDLRTLDDLSRYFRDEVVAAAEVQYAES